MSVKYLTNDERSELDELMRLVDNAVVLRNQRLRAQADVDRYTATLAEVTRKAEMAAILVENQRVKMTVARTQPNAVKSLATSGVAGSPE